MNKIKFKAKKTFNWKGFPISLKKDNELLFHQKNSWEQDKIYEGYYYDGGVMCPVSAYIIDDSNGNRQTFTQILTKAGGYMCVYDYFDFEDPERDHIRYVWNFCYRCNNNVFNLLEDDDIPICPYCNDLVQLEKIDGNE